MHNEGNDNPMIAPDILIENTARNLLPQLQAWEHEYEKRRQLGCDQLADCVHRVQLDGIVSDDGPCLYCRYGATLEEWALDIARQRFGRHRREIHDLLVEVVTSWRVDLFYAHELTLVGSLLDCLAGDLR